MYSLNIEKVFRKWLLNSVREIKQNKQNKNNSQLAPSSSHGAFKMLKNLVYT